MHVNSTAVCFWLKSEIDLPLLVPDHLEGSRGNFGHKGQNLRPAEHSEASFARLKTTAVAIALLCTVAASG